MKQGIVDNKNSRIGLEIVFPASSVDQAWSCLRYGMHSIVVDLCFLNVVFLAKFFSLITSEDVDTMAEFLVHCVTLAK